MNVNVSRSLNEKVDPSKQFSTLIMRDQEKNYSYVVSRKIQRSLPISFRKSLDNYEAPSTIPSIPSFLPSSQPNSNSVTRSKKIRFAPHDDDENNHDDNDDDYEKCEIASSLGTKSCDTNQSLSPSPPVLDKEMYLLYNSYTWRMYNRIAQKRISFFQDPRWMEQCSSASNNKKKSSIPHKEDEEQLTLSPLSNARTIGDKKLTQQQQQGSDDSSHSFCSENSPADFDIFTLD